MSMTISRSGRQTHITQRNSGEIARKALVAACCAGLGAFVALVIYALLLGQFLSGAVPMAGFVIATIMLPPGALALTLAASTELANALPRQIVVDTTGITVRFSTPFPFAKHIMRAKSASERAIAIEKRHSNYVSMPSDMHHNIAGIRSRQSHVRYNGRLIGPFDASDVEGLAETINAALEVSCGAV